MNKFYIFSVLIFTFISCSTSDEVRDYINLQANPYLTKHVNYGIYKEIVNDQPIIYFNFEIRRDELTFLQTDTDYVCHVEVNLTINKSELETAWDTTYTQIYRFKTFEETKLPMLENHKHRIALPAGKYNIVCNISDAPQADPMRIRTNLTIPSLSDTVVVSNVRFKNSDQNTYSLTKRLSFNFHSNPSVFFEVLNRDLELPYRVRLKITRVKSDTTIARSLQSLTPAQGSVETRGYKLYEPENTLIMLDSIIMPNNQLTQYFHLSLPLNLTEGVYYAELNIKPKDRKLISAGKELFYIFPNNFPEIKTIKEAVAILKYLTYPNEYEEILSGGDSLLKENFDKFWLKISSGNVSAAKKKVALFYQRITDANFLFSNYKAGWKTDLGMLYILLGQPANVQWQPTSLTWYYYYKKSAANIPFQFYPIRNDERVIGYYLERYFEYDDFFVENRRIWERN